MAHAFDYQIFRIEAFSAYSQHDEVSLKRKWRLRRSDINDALHEHMLLAVDELGVKLTSLYLFKLRLLIHLFLFFGEDFGLFVTEHFVGKHLRVHTFLFHSLGVLLLTIQTGSYLVEFFT